MSILTTIYGVSDDLIEIESVGFREELDVFAPGTIVLSDGTEIDVEYGSVWTIRVAVLGPGTTCVAARRAIDVGDTGAKHPAIVGNVPGYSGFVMLTMPTPLTWATKAAS